MDLLVWFEPERVRPGTALHREHPEWLLDCDELDDGNCGVARNYMLNLADPDCVKWLTGHMNSLIKEYGITIFRQDFNFPPLRFWQENDTQDRQGSTENLYIQGYLRFWDGMLESNPGLWIDSCASGGRRNDLETMRRSIPSIPPTSAMAIRLSARPLSERSTNGCRSIRSPLWTGAGRTTPIPLSGST